MRLLIDGQEVRAVTLTSARGRDLVSLQTQTGFGLDELEAMEGDKTKQALLVKCMEFLAEHNRGKFLSWDEIMDRPMAVPLLDEIDKKRAGIEDEDAPEAGPTPAPTDSPSAGASKPAPKRASGTRKSPSSTGASRGSKTRSTPASSTS